MDYSLLTEQKISEKYNGLPQNLKDVVSSADTSVVIGNIATKYRLDEEKTAMLIQLVGLVILGFVSFEDMKEEMKETIDISPQFIPLVADEIRQKIFSPVINSLQPAPATPKTTSPTPPYQGGEKREVVDKYREPTFSMPEVVDLRKTPPSPAEAGYGGQRPPADREGGLPPELPVAPPPAPAPKPITPTQPSPQKPILPTPPTAPTSPPPTPPLTLTRPIEPPKPIPTTPLIEAEPHQIPTPAHTAPIVPKPQYIMRPSGLPPTDLPDNVLDLRKDKGEF